MKPTFLIFGRPRSRTAWLANFLTYRNSICLHEGLADSLGNWDVLASRLEAQDAEVVGNADTGMIHWVDEALERYPDAPMVLLESNGKRWRQYVTEQGWPEFLITDVNSNYRRARRMLEGRENVLCVDVEKIPGNEAVVNVITAHCGVRFSYNRWRFLKDLNVQVSLPALKQRVERALEKG